MLAYEEYVKCVERYSNMIYRLAYSWLKNSSDADDIAQEVLIKLYTTDMEFESEDHRKNWLARVTINSCKSLFRAPWQRWENLEDYENTLEFQKEDYRELFEAVMKLDRKYRVPIILFYYEGYSTADIAGFLQVSENTVSTRLRRAKIKLKNYLEEV